MRRLAAVLALAAFPASAAAEDVITLDNDVDPVPLCYPFISVERDVEDIWIDFSGYVYTEVPAFELKPGDRIAFDTDTTLVGQLPKGETGEVPFDIQLDISLAVAADDEGTSEPDADGFTRVVNDGIPADPNGNDVALDYDLEFTADTAFSFPGGGLIVRFSDPGPDLAATSDCRLASISGMSGREPLPEPPLVSGFRGDLDGDYPWIYRDFQFTGETLDVAFMRIITSECGDEIMAVEEECDDGNDSDDDGCLTTCVEATCGDGFVNEGAEDCDSEGEVTADCNGDCTGPTCGDGFFNDLAEECDISDPDHPDPFCDDDCHLAAIAKGTGCDAGGGSGLLVGGLLALLLLALRRRRAAVAAFALLAATSTASAQVDGFRVDRFEVAPTVDDGITLQLPTTIGDGRWSASAMLGASNTLLRVTPVDSDDDGVNVVGARLTGELGFVMGFLDRFEVNAALPIALAQATDGGDPAAFMLEEPGSTALGDPRLGGSVRLFGGPLGPQAGVAATVSLPLGSEEAFTGDGGVGGMGLVTGAFATETFTVAVNGGARFRPEADYVTSDQGTELIARGGVLVPLMDGVLVPSVEVDTIMRAGGSQKYEELSSPVLGLVGARYRLPAGFVAGAAVGAGLTEAPGSPAVRGLITLHYSPQPEPAPIVVVKGPVDTDGDGLYDHEDRCPLEPEDRDNFEDEDGCPDPDNDKDTILDVADACVNDPETKNGFEDVDGCPDVLRDSDKLLTLEEVVTLPAPVEFEFDTAILLPGADPYLERVLEVLRNHPEVTKLEVQGHTSSEGGPAYNMDLSERRARAVVDWLVNHGADPGRLQARGYGLTQPLGPNDSEANRQKNRRVQFRVLETNGQPAPVETAPPAPAPAPAPKTP
ncbi:MAG TPA: OmpA family protein [Kofleriaceae bacterium]|nr:OmpA family protein [Kofleriaceae bacterium]